MDSLKYKNINKMDISFICILILIQLLSYIKIDFNLGIVYKPQKTYNIGSTIIYKSSASNQIGTVIAKRGDLVNTNNNVLTVNDSFVTFDGKLVGYQKTLSSPITVQDIFFIGDLDDSRTEEETKVLGLVLYKWKY